jgi:hypothetical protein
MIVAFLTKIFNNLSELLLSVPVILDSAGLEISVSNTELL